MDLSRDELLAIAFLVNHHRARRLPVPHRVGLLAQRVDHELHCAATGTTDTPTEPPSGGVRTSEPQVNGHDSSDGVKPSDGSTRQKVATRQNENGSPPAGLTLLTGTDGGTDAISPNGGCRFCAAELKPHQQARGFCGAAGCVIANREGEGR